MNYSQYEKDIQKFLKRLGLRDVNGGKTFKLGDHQIDACGGFDNALFIINCKICIERQHKDLREFIIKERGKVNSIKAGIRADSNYKKYGDIKFVICCGNMEINDKDRDFAQKKGEIPIYIWDDSFVNYYSDLYRTIKKFAVYNLISEMKIKPRVQDSISVPAFNILVSDYSIYSFFVKPKDLLKVAYVARRDMSKEEYYQRILSSKRLENIKKFLNDGGIFPNNIIVSFNEKVNFTEFKEVDLNEYGMKQLKFGILQFPNNYTTCWVIDGQHRLYAFTRTERDVPVSVIAFRDLNIERQAAFFIEINNEQKTVNPNLLWDLQGSMRPDTEEGKISRIVKKLNEDGVLKDKIYMPLRHYTTKVEGKKLTLVNLCSAIKKRKLTEEITETMSGRLKNPLFSQDPNTLVRRLASSLNEFLTVVNDIFDNKIHKEFLFSNNGLSILVALFERFIVYFKSIPGSTDYEQFLKVLKEEFNISYSETDFKKLAKTCSNEAGRSDTIEEFCKAMKKIDPDFGGQIKVTTLHQEVIDLEIELRKFICKVLFNDDQYWLNTRITGAIRQDIEDKAKQEGNIKKPEEYLTLGQIQEIIKRKDNWENTFKKIFIKEYSQEERVISDIQYLTKVRNDLFHHNKINNKDIDYIVPIIKKLRRCLS